MVNKVTLIGNVGNDPEVRYVSENVPVATFRLATSETFTGKTGERITNTEWHNIVLWRGLAKIVETYIKKGSMVYIEGKITYRSYEKDGQKLYFTEIVADQMRMLGKKEGGNLDSTSSSQSQQPSIAHETAPSYDIASAPTDDLPF
jgi:single-strand DNA-binding protein